MDERAKADCLANARALAPVITAAVPRIETHRELPADLVAALHEARLFRMLVPRSLGGEEISAPAYVRVIEELARADASTAWCIAQTSVCSMIASCLPPAIGAEIFKDNPRGVLAWGPLGRSARAIADKGGFRLTGAWPFASGSRHATWLAAHSAVYDANGEARRDANGNPVEMTFVFPRDCATISDVWRVIGLKGTGSDSYAVSDLFVPEDRGIGAFARNPAERHEHGPLYSFTVHQLFGASFGSIGLGVAQSTLDAFIALACTKIPTGGKTLLRDNGFVQTQVGLAAAKLASARVFLHHALADMWEAACQSGTVPVDRRVRLRMASTYASHQAKEVVDSAYQAAGATAIFEDNPFERRFRDMHTVAQQVQAHFSIFEAIGQHILGLPLHPRFF
ncbi:MAG TPA: acyl-CoA dehydrogenase family protein [Xanthobacteraceae bacterium]|jgi:alkylation response protein AidB-like acyl-CoA dehydrogenase